MNLGKISVSDAARMAKVSRRTVQRALDEGRLSWHGPRFGRYAAGLYLGDVIAAFPARNRKQRKHSPVHVRVIQNIGRVGGDWRLVFGAINNLIGQGRVVDLDLVAAAFACLHEPLCGYLSDFCAVVEGREVGRFDRSRYGLRLGWAVQKSLTDFGAIPETVSALEAWRGMQDVLLGPNAPQSRGRPYLFFGDCVGLEVLPSWDNVQSRGKLKETPKMGEVTASSKTLLARLEKTTRQRFNKALRVLSDAVATRGQREYMRDAWPIVKAYLENEGTSSKKYRREATEHLQGCGVDLTTVADLRRGLVKMRKLADVITETDLLGSGGEGDSGDDDGGGGIGESATKNDVPGHPKMVMPDVGDRATRLSKAAVASVMGVSRMTVYYWKRKTAKLAAFHAPRQIIVRCRSCDEPVGADATECPACRALL